MAGIPVILIDEGIDWPAWVQAIGSVVAIIVSVGAAVYLQDRERRLHEVAEGRRQLTVLCSLGDRCTDTLTHLRRRSVNGELNQNRILRYFDELDADELALSEVSLASLADESAIVALATLRKYVRAARRRLRYAAQKLERGDQYKRDDFDLPMRKAREATNTLRKLRDAQQRLK